MLKIPKKKSLALQQRLNAFLASGIRVQGPSMASKPGGRIPIRPIPLLLVAPYTTIPVDGEREERARRSEITAEEEGERENNTRPARIAARQ